MRAGHFTQEQYLSVITLSVHAFLLLRVHINDIIQKTKLFTSLKKVCNSSVIQFLIVKCRTFESLVVCDFSFELVKLRVQALECFSQPSVAHAVTRFTASQCFYHTCIEVLCTVCEPRLHA